AYLETLPPAERDRQEQARRRCEGPLAAAAGPGPLAADPACRSYLEGRAAFRAGDLVRADPAVFWAGAGGREAIIKDVKGLFRPGATPPRLAPQPPDLIPLHSQDGGRLLLHYDLRLQFPDAAQRGPRLQVEGR